MKSGRSKFTGADGFNQAGGVDRKVSGDATNKFPGRMDYDSVGPIKRQGITKSPGKAYSNPKKNAMTTADAGKKYIEGRKFRTGYKDGC